MITIEGTVIPGLSAAARTLPRQWPTVVRFIPAIQQCEQRTKRRINRKRREDTVAKGQLRSNREKKKPKAEKNKKQSAPVPSVFERVRMIGKDASGKKFS
jgi:hypothetical protein